MPVYLIILPLIGALIGWVTNRLAIRMLFHPRKPRRIFGMQWQGLIPQRHAEIAEKAGDIVADELIGHHVLREAVENIDIEPALNDTITSLIWDRLAPRLRAIPLFGRMVNDKLIAQIHILAAEELHRELPNLRSRVGTAAEEHLDLRRMVSARVLAFELSQLEALIYSLAGRELKRIEWLGGVLGFLIGVVQALFVWLTT